MGSPQGTDTYSTNKNGNSSSQLPLDVLVQRRVSDRVPNAIPQRFRGMSRVLNGFRKVASRDFFGERTRASTKTHFLRWIASMNPRIENFTEDNETTWGNRPNAPPAVLGAFFSNAPVSWLRCLDLNEILWQDLDAKKNTEVHPTKIRRNKNDLVFWTALNSTWRPNLCGLHWEKRKLTARPSPLLEQFEHRVPTATTKGGTRQTAVVKTGGFYKSEGTDF